MKFSRPGIRTWILLLYLVVSIGSLLLLNNVFQTNQQEIQETMNKLELSDDLRMVRPDYKAEPYADRKSVV